MVWSLLILLFSNSLFISRLERKEVNLTCYQSTYQQTGSNRNITASGSKIENPERASRLNWAASSPDLNLVFGARVYIESQNRIVTIKDRTSKRIHNTIDILEDFGKLYKFKAVVIIYNLRN